MAAKLLPVIVLCALPVLPAASDSVQVAQRDEYPIHLPKIAASCDGPGLCEKVRITFGESSEYTVITPLQDQLVKNTKSGRQTTVHQEDPDRSYFISDFEARELAKVTKEFQATLKELEVNLQKKKWAKCRYLDCFFPRFLAGFYHLYNTARASADALPRSALVADSLFDVSLASPKTDRRVAFWENNPEQVLRLRILCKELGYQLQTWEERELTDGRRSREVSHGEKLEETFTIFVRLYFNLPAPKK